MPALQSRDTLRSLETLTVGDQTYTYYSLKAAEQTLGELSHLPCCVRILLENLLRHEDELTVTVEHMRALSAFHALRKDPPPLAFRPSRLLLNGKTALSTLGDLTVLREALAKEKDDPFLLTLDQETDIVLDDIPGISADTLEILSFLRWGEQAFPKLRLIPPGKGTGDSTHVNFLAPIVSAKRAYRDEVPLLFPDTVYGVSRRISMVGCLGVLAFATDALNMEALLLDSHAPLFLSGVLGVKVTGKPSNKSSATDIALALLKVIRQNKHNGKIIEFYGNGLDYLRISDRAVIADILCESDALSVLFPVDKITIDYLKLNGEVPERTELIEAYCKAQGLWREGRDSGNDIVEPSFTSSLSFELGAQPQSLGGPGRTYSPVPLKEAAESFRSTFPLQSRRDDPLAPVKHGDVIWAAVGPYGGAFHPYELIAAGLVARKARRLGLRVQPWVRASFHVPCPILRDFILKSGLKEDIEAIGFLWIEDAGIIPPIQENISYTIHKDKLAVCALATGTEELGSAIHPLCAAGYLAAPALIVAYALAGNLHTNLANQPLKQDANERPILLQEIWPSAAEREALLNEHPLSVFLEKRRNALFEASDAWQRIEAESGPLYPWKDSSVLLRRPSVLDDYAMDIPERKDIKGAKTLLLLGDNVSTAQIVAKGRIDSKTEAGRYLLARGVAEEKLGTFEHYTGNENVMVRGAFTGPGLINALSKDETPGLTVHKPSGLPMTLLEAAQRYQKEGQTILVAAGKDFGAGPAQEWAAKSMRLLGISVVIAESFGAGYRLNLIRAGILPLQIKTGLTLPDLKITGEETLNISGITEFSQLPMEVMLTVDHVESIERFMLRCRLDTSDELELWQHGSLWAESLRNTLMLAE